MSIHDYLSHQLLIINLHFFVSSTQPSINLNYSTTHQFIYHHPIIISLFNHSHIYLFHNKHPLSLFNPHVFVTRLSCYHPPTISSNYSYLAPTHPSILSTSYIPSIISPIPFILQSFHLSHHYQHSTHHMPLLHSFIVPS